MLATRRIVLRSEGNLNNEIGLPLTLLRLRAEHEAAVLEMGFYTTGEIALLAGLARPSIGVVTAVRGVHLSRAGSLDAIEAGKRELVEALPADGWAILNADDERVLRMRSHTHARVLVVRLRARRRRAAPTTSGRSGRTACASGSAPADERRDVTTPALGRHGVHNALAAAAVGIAARASTLDDDRRSASARPAPAPHRSQLIRSGALHDPRRLVQRLARRGRRRARPARRAARTPRRRPRRDARARGRRRATRTAAWVATPPSVVDALVVVGEGAAGIADGARRRRARRARRSSSWPTATRRARSWRERLRPGDVVLVKASRGAALDLLVEPLAALGRDLAAGR